MYVHAKHVAEKMVELMEMIERAPVSNNEYFQKAMRTSQKLCSGGQARGQAHGNQSCTQPSQFASTQADNFWGKEEVLKIIQEVEAANPKKDKPSTTTTSYPAWVDDMPSFDLGIGFTSEEPNLEPASDSGNKDRDVCESPILKEVFRDRGKKKDAMHPKSDASNQPDNKGDRIRKKPETLCSPFLNRAVEAKTKLSKIEREVAYYVMHSDKLSNEQIIFKHGDVLLRSKEIASLRPELYVYADVVSAWSVILNVKEKLRAPGSPFRFFASVNATLNCLSRPNGEDWSPARCEDWFCTNLQHEFDLVGARSIAEFDLFFFPIYDTQVQHFYVACIDIRKKVLVVIDNRNVEAQNCLFMTKYRTGPLRLVKYFAAFLRKKEMNEMASKVDVLDHEIPMLTWVAPENDADCAVYTMRHMETYMGQNNWMHGFNRKSTKQLRYMRARYCFEIVHAECNEERETILKDAAAFCLELQKSSKVDLESKVINWECVGFRIIKEALAKEALERKKKKT